MKRPKHKNDGNHGKSGWVGGNPRYDRNNPSSKMGRSHGARTTPGAPFCGHVYLTRTESAQ